MIIPKSTKLGATFRIHWQKLLLGTGTLLLLTGCTATVETKPDQPEKHLEKTPYEIAKPVRSIPNISRINGWRYLDSQAVILSASPKKQYLVTLKDDCTELNNSERIATNSPTDQLTSFDKLIVLPSIGSKRNCYVDQLFLLQKNNKE